MTRPPLRCRIFVVALLSVVGSPCHARVWYVNQGSSQSPRDGSSFAHGFQRVQQGLSAASSGDEVWVEAATYNERTTMVTPGVGLFGGFAGTETAHPDNPAANPTILDGTSLAASPVTITDSASGGVLDGFTIQHGTGTQTSDGVHTIYAGGAVFGGTPSSFTISRCTIQDNHIDIDRNNNIYDNDGGAFYFCCGGNWTISNCSFLTNSATNGGAIWGQGGSAAILNCGFAGNNAYLGGAILFRSTNDTVQNSNFLLNSSFQGGGIYSSGPRANGEVISGNYFAGNTAGNDGGAVYQLQVYFADIIGNTFSSNSASSGGGAYVDRGDAIRVVGNIFTTNTASQDGGGVEAFGPTTGDPVILIGNNAFLGNSARSPDAFGHGGGGGIAAGFGANVINNTVANNTGGGLSMGSNRITANNIVAFNDFGIASSSVNVGGILHFDDVFGNSHGDYIGFGGNSNIGVGEISRDPLFVDLAHGNFHLQAPSPCIDGGSKGDSLTYGASTDFEGDPRIFGSNVDIGADEALPVLVFSTQPGGGGAGHPLKPQPVVSARDSLGAPFTRFTGAVSIGLAPGFGTSGAVLSGGTTVNAVSGSATFSDLSVDTRGTGYRLTASSPFLHSVSSSGFTILLGRCYVRTNGSDANDGSTWANAKQTIATATVVTAGPAGEIWVAKGTYTDNVSVPNGVTIYGGFAGTESALSERDFRANPTIVQSLGLGAVFDVTAAGSGPDTGVDGFAITGGTGYPVTGPLGVPHTEGGGIYVNAANPIIQNCTLTGNTATAGGAISVTNASATVRNNTISGNTAPAIAGLAGRGGGVYLSAADGTVLAGNIVHNNAATGSTSTNTASFGGALAVGGGAPAIVNNTFASNSSPAGQGDIAILNASPVLTNNIIANTAAIASIGGTPVFSHNDYVPGAAVLNQIPDPSGTNGNISADPQLVNASAGDMHISPASPCLDTGDSSAATTAGLTVDIDGEVRVFGPAVDIGADESVPHLAFVTSPGNTGLNKPLHPSPIVVARDASGSAYLPFSGPVTVSILTGPGGATLHGTTTMNAVSGIATFTDLSLDVLGTYALQASNPQIGTANSATFKILLAHTFVKTTGLDTRSGDSWTNAKKTISATLAATAGPAAEVWVAKGTYIDTPTIPDGVALEGGFLGTETSLSQRDFRANVTTINANGQGPVVMFDTNAGTGTAVDGFTLTGGTGFPVTRFGLPIHFEGGGVYVKASAAIENNVITGNTANLGGGIAVLSGSPTILYNTIHDNSADAATDLAGAGGGLWLTGSGALVADNLVFHNAATGSTTTSAPSYGGAMAITNGSPAIRDNTFVSNASPTHSGDIDLRNSSSVFTNNIINNHAGIAITTGTPSFSHNDYIPGVAVTNEIADPTGTSGNVNLTPGYVSAAVNNYHLAPTSPIINLGDNAVVVPKLELDIDGDRRIIGGVVDIGADEVVLTPYTFADAATSLRIAGGLQTATSADLRLNAESPSGIDVLDAVRIARKVAGLEANP